MAPDPLDTPLLGSVVDNSHRYLEGSHSCQPGTALTSRTPHVLGFFSCHTPPRYVTPYIISKILPICTRYQRYTTTNYAVHRNHITSVGIIVLATSSTFKSGLGVTKAKQRNRQEKCHVFLSAARSSALACDYQEKTSLSPMIPSIALAR